MMYATNNFTTQQQVEDRLNAINYYNGRAITIIYGKDYGNGVEKVVKYYGRLGVNYNHISRVIAQRELKKAMGIEPKQRKSSDTTINTYLILNKNGELKLRIVPLFNNHMKAKSDYYYNGNPTTKQWLIDNGLLKEQERETPNEFTIMLKNLIALGV